MEDNFRFFDISGDNAADPKLVAEYAPTLNPHEFFIWQDPKKKGRTLMYMSNPGAGTRLSVTDISDARKGKFKEIAEFQTLIPTPGTDNRIHSLTVTSACTSRRLAGDTSSSTAPRLRQASRNPPSSWLPTWRIIRRGAIPEHTAP
jgi:hypothetical protein